MKGRGEGLKSFCTFERATRRAAPGTAKGIKDPRERAREADRLEDLSREAERLEQEIARAAR